jgi:hypothetical protein
MGFNQMSNNEDFTLVGLKSQIPERSDGTPNMPIMFSLVYSDPQEFPKTSILVLILFSIVDVRVISELYRCWPAV